MSYREPDDSNVRIEFYGLLVGRFNADESTYEVGVLPAPMHNFQIVVEKTGPMGSGGTLGGGKGKHSSTIIFDHILPHDRVWEIGIEGADVDASLFYAKKRDADTTWIFKRTTPDKELTPQQKLDFRWAIDLEKDFPEHQIPDLLRPDLLYPILRVKNGLFYSFQRSGLALMTKHKHDDPKPYGRVSEIVAVDLPVQNGGEVVLKVTPPDSNDPTIGEVFRLRIQPNQKYVIQIINTESQGNPQSAPRPSSSGSDPNSDLEKGHFQMLYLLLDVPPSDWYDLIPTVPTGRESDELMALALKERVPIPSGEGIPSPYKCSLSHLGLANGPIEDIEDSSNTEA